MSWVLEERVLLGREVGEGMSRGNSQEQMAESSESVGKRSKEICFRTSPVVQWLRLHAPNAGGLGSIPGQGTKSHMLQTSKTEGPTCCN